MIEVRLKIKDKTIKGFEVSGHAFHGEPGHDIVCSAVSMLTINTINSHECILELEKEISIKEFEDTLFFEIDINKLENDKLHDTQILMKSFELGIKSIVKEYQDYITLYYKEV